MVYLVRTMIALIVLFALFASSSAELSTRSGSDCLETAQNIGSTRWNTPLVKVADKYFYFGTFFKASWFRSLQYCRYHGMDLASISTEDENEALKLYIQKAGMPLPLWLSASDLDKEGTFLWYGNGRSFSYKDWHKNQPDNWKNPSTNLTENCMGFWKNDNGLKWNDINCFNEYNFICEIQ